MQTPISALLSCALLSAITGCAPGGAGGDKRATGDTADAAGTAAEPGDWGAEDAPGSGGSPDEEPAEGPSDDADAMDTAAPDEAGARAPAGCGALRLRDAEAADEDGDGRWAPGELLWVQAALENAGDEPIYDAPGAILSAHEDDALVPEPLAAVYSLDAGAQALLRWWLVAAPTAEAGRPVPLELQVVTAPAGTPEPCAEAEPLRLRLHLSG